MPSVVHPAERPHRRGRSVRARRLAVTLVVGLGALGTRTLLVPPTVAAQTAPSGVSTTAADGTASTLPQAATDGSGTTTTTSTESPPDDPAQKQLRLIIIGLVVLAVVVLALTVFLWRATSPARVVTVVPVGDGGDVEEGFEGDDVPDDGDEPLERVAGARRRPAAEQSSVVPADPFSVALMSPSSPLVVPTSSVAPAPSVVVADPVEWPEVEPQRLDLPDPPVFDDEAPEDPGEPPEDPRAGNRPELGVRMPARRARTRPVRDWGDREPVEGADGGYPESPEGADRKDRSDDGAWQGIRPLGPVERGEP
jgi:hypothetical protein